MATRRFSADNSVIRFPIGATDTANFTSAFTLAAVARLRANAVWHALLGHHTSGGVAGPSIEIGNDNRIYLTTNHGSAGSSGASPATMVLNNTTDWWLVVITKGAGTVIPRFHLQNLTAGTAMSHAPEASPATVADGVSQASGTIRTGEWEGVDDANANIAVLGGWATAMSDVQCEALGANDRTADWTGHALTPVYVYDLNQATVATVPDLVGTRDSNATTGTTVEAIDPPGWVYGAGGGGGGPTVVDAPAGMFEVDLVPKAWF
jgi:hypothetical protein